MRCLKLFSFKAALAVTIFSLATWAVVYYERLNSGELPSEFLAAIRGTNPAHPFWDWYSCPWVNSSGYVVDCFGEPDGTECVECSDMNDYIYAATFMYEPGGFVEDGPVFCGGKTVRECLNDTCSGPVVSTDICNDITMFVPQ